MHGPKASVARYGTNKKPPSLHPSTSTKTPCLPGRRPLGHPPLHPSIHPHACTHLADEEEVALGHGAVGLEEVGLEVHVEEVARHALWVGCVWGVWDMGYDQYWEWVLCVWEVGGGGVGYGRY